MLKKIKKEIKSIHSSIFLMHKYWGKKPANELKNIIEKYTKPNQTILDPFCGFGGIGIEAKLINRNVILNDLNPMANFINKCILDENFNEKKFEKFYIGIKEKYEKIEKKWYLYKGDIICTTLRDKYDRPIKHKIKKDKKMEEKILKNDEIVEFIEFEKKQKIENWYPDIKLIKNSRICIKEDMQIKDVFPKRALICNAFLYDLINELNDCIEKDLLFLAFTSNVANCSKLVPPIKSRGEMSQGAWMTGFYIGELYLENNVFHYFENRVNKILKGKKEYIAELNKKDEYGKHQITNFDAKNLRIKDESIDFVFTDFPYGDTVPYFEQSQLWNAWLKMKADYDNEIVVSDSSERNKTISQFTKDIGTAISEIARVMKDNSYFVFTFHSITGIEWEALVQPLEKNNFEFIDCNLLTQKTFTPRQLNRVNSIKGDIEVVYKKNKYKKQQNEYNVDEIIKMCFENCIVKNKLYETHEIINFLIKYMLKYKHKKTDISFLEVLKNNFESENEKWRIK